MVGKYLHHFYLLHVGFSLFLTGIADSTETGSMHGWCGGS